MYFRNFRSNYKMFANKRTHHVYVSQKLSFEKFNFFKKGYKTMKQVELINVEKSYPNKKLLDDISLTISYGDKLTLVGENGVGKSTLARIIAKKCSCDGKVIVEEDTRIGYLPQDVSDFADENSFYLVREFLFDFNPEFIAYQEKISDIDRFLENESLSENEKNKLSEDRKAILSEFNSKGGFRLSKLMAGLNLSHIAMDRNINTLSGGERTRLALVRLLNQEPDLLVLDEPTNHLDLSALEWLGNYLKNYRASVVLITHDRTLLDKISRNILEIDSKGKLNSFGGRYIDFINEKRKQFERQIQNYVAQEKQKKLLRSDIDNSIHTSSTYKPVRKDNFKLGFNSKGERSQKSAGRDIKKKNLQLSRLEENSIEKPIEQKKHSWLFSANAVNHKGGISFNGITKIISGKLILDNCSGSLSLGQRAIIIGNNGSGKSTLLNIIAGKVSPDKGEVFRPSGLKIGYLMQEQSDLDKEATVLEEFNKVVDLPQHLLIPELEKYLPQSRHMAKMLVGELSIGQQKRLQLAKIIANEPDVLLLDEPTNHLDYINVEYLEEQLLTFPGIILAVTHDRWFIKKFTEATLMELSDGELKISNKNSLRPS